MIFLSFLLLVSCAQKFSENSTQEIDYANIPLELLEEDAAPSTTDKKEKGFSFSQLAHDIKALWKTARYSQARDLLHEITVEQHTENAQGADNYPTLENLGELIAQEQSFRKVALKGIGEQLNHPMALLGFKSQLYKQMKDQIKPRAKPMAYELSAASLWNIFQKKIQCFSGTTYMELLLEKSLSVEKYRSLNRVLIHLPGHILPGFFLKNKKSGEWGLHGIEMTVAGWGHKYFGPASKLEGKIVVVDAELARVVHLLRNHFKDVEQRRHAANYALFQTANKYGIDLRKVDAYVIGGWLAGMDGQGGGAVTRYFPLNIGPFAILGSPNQSERGATSPPENLPPEASALPQELVSRGHAPAKFQAPFSELAEADLDALLEEIIQEHQDYLR
jgi:hypothetical protein